MDDLKGKVALVTGGSTGIGAAVCREFARLDARAVVHYFSSQDAAQGLVEEIVKAGG